MQTDKATESVSKRIHEALPRTKFNRDLIALCRAAEGFREQVKALWTDHETVSVGNELVGIGGITRDELVFDRAVYEELDEATGCIGAAYAFLWVLGAFISALEVNAHPINDVEFTNEDEPAPCAVVGGKDGA